MQDMETVLRSNRERMAVMLGEDFLEKSSYLAKYYNAIMSKCDPVQQAAVQALRTHVEQYERCVAEIMANGFTIQECVDVYEKVGVC